MAGDFPACYAFKEQDPHHLNHGIRVRALVRLANQVISIYNHQLAGWYGRLSGLRLPLIKLPDFEATFRAILDELERTPTKDLPESPLDDFLASTLTDVLSRMKTKLRGIAAANATISFEAVCEYLLASWGYTIAGRHEYDGPAAMWICAAFVSARTCRPSRPARPSPSYRSRSTPARRTRAP